MGVGSNGVDGRGGQEGGLDEEQMALFANESSLAQDAFNVGVYDCFLSKPAVGGSTLHGSGEA